MSALPSEPYYGTRDWYPEDMRLRNYIFRTWRRVAKGYGYESYDSPLLEPIDIYTSKSGHDLVHEQTYQFVDRGEHRVAIRPEMTPSVSRMVAAHYKQMTFPARWYNIGQFMRYVQPGAGREREFWQINCDIFGMEGPLAEAECIGIGVDIMHAFGATDDMFVVRINNRKIIDYMMTHYLGLDAVQAHLMMKLFERRSRVSPEEFRDKVIDIYGHEAAHEGLQRIAHLMAAKTMADLPEALRDSEPVREIQQLFTCLERAGVKNAMFDITLMRSLDYYTGTVFEFFDTHPGNHRPLFAGGRYDGLVGLFGDAPIEAVGMACGLTTMQAFLEAHHLMPRLYSTTDVYMALADESLHGAMLVAKELRGEGVHVELDMIQRPRDEHISIATHKSIPHVVFVGATELRSEMFTVYNTVTGIERKMSLERLISAIEDRRQKHSREDEEFDLSEVV